MQLPAYNDLSDGLLTAAFGTSDAMMKLLGLSLSTTPARTQAARKSYLTSVELLVELASLQTAFLTLDEAIKTTNRRVNALDSVVKPMLENTIAYIKVHRAARLAPVSRTRTATEICARVSLQIANGESSAACGAEVLARSALLVAINAVPALTMAAANDVYGDVIDGMGGRRASWTSWSARSSSA